MGKFDGILLLSDWDGTLSSGGVISQKNVDAIKYFTENGGYFTVCSGRFKKFIKDKRGDIDINTYVSCCNGAIIVDLDTDEVVYKGFCDDALFFILEQICGLNAKFRGVRICLATEDDPIEFPIEELPQRLEQYKDEKIYKVLLTADGAENAESCKAALESLDLGDYYVARSWVVGFEIQKKSSSKGAALKRLAEKTGAKMTFAVGDYENDISMIEAADVGYAVDNSCDALRRVADKITVNVAEGAIAAVIKDIEDNYIYRG